MNQCKSPSAFSGLSRHLLASGQVSVYREEHERLNTIHLNSGRMKELSIPPEMKRDEFNRPGAWRTDGMWRLSGGAAVLALGWGLGVHITHAISPMVTTASVPDGKGEVGTPEDSLYAVLLVKETHPLPEYLPHFAFPLGRCCKPSCFIDPIGRIDFFF